MLGCSPAAPRHAVCLRKVAAAHNPVCFVPGAAGVLVGHPFDTVKVG